MQKGKIGTKTNKNGKKFTQNLSSEETLEPTLSSLANIAPCL